MTLKGFQPVILNGERICVVTENVDRPRWIPGFVWKWMVKMVVQRQKVTIQRNVVRG